MIKVASWEEAKPTMVSSNEVVYVRKPVGITTEEYFAVCPKISGKRVHHFYATLSCRDIWVYCKDGKYLYEEVSEPKDWHLERMLMELYRYHVNYWEYPYFIPNYNSMENVVLSLETAKAIFRHQIISGFGTPHSYRFMKDIGEDLSAL